MPSIHNLLDRRSLIASAGLAILAGGVPAMASPSPGKFRTAARLPALRSGPVAPHDVNVWLPDDAAPGTRHPVLYIVDLEQVPDNEQRMHDAGGPSGHLAALAAAALCRSAIVVGIGAAASGLRHYTPAAPLALLPPELRARALGALGGAPLSDTYLQCLVAQVKPAVDRAFPTLPGPAHSFIAGADMGGLLSLYALTRYPRVFGGAASLSTERAMLPPDLMPEADFPTWRGAIERAIARYLAETLPRARTHRLYVDYSDPSRDALSAPLRHAVERISAARGYVRYRDLQSEPLTQRDRTEQGRRERADVAATLLLKACFERAETD